MQLIKFDYAIKLIVSRVDHVVNYNLVHLVSCLTSSN